MCYSFFWWLVSGYLLDINARMQFLSASTMPNYHHSIISSFTSLLSSVILKFSILAGAKTAVLCSGCCETVWMCVYLLSSHLRIILCRGIILTQVCIQAGWKGTVIYSSSVLRSAQRHTAQTMQRWLGKPCVHALMFSVAPGFDTREPIMFLCLFGTADYQQINHPHLCCGVVQSPRLPWEPLIDWEYQREIVTVLPKGQMPWALIRRL